MSANETIDFRQMLRRDSAEAARGQLAAWTGTRLESLKVRPTVNSGGAARV